MCVALSGAALAAGGCGADASDDAAGAARTAAALAALRRPREPGALCDVPVPADRALRVRWPVMADGARPPSAPGRWRWTNVWATWCPPCTEELPRLRRMTDALRARGIDVALALVSADDADALGRHVALHPEDAGSARLGREEDLPALLEGLGLGVRAGLPLHVLEAPDGSLRCVRVGAVHEGEVDALEALLRAR